MSVIPDAIEPVEGWKAWDVKDGYLVSRQHTRWLPGEPLTAACDIPPSWRMEWQAVSFKEEPVPPPVITSSAVSYASSLIATASYSYTGPTVAQEVSHPPRVLLPPGYRWEQRQIIDERHDAPGDHCSCGVYMASTRERAQPYGKVLGKIKGWGKTIVHTSGWRVQYAYPSELLVPKGVELVDYGVPVLSWGAVNPMLVSNTNFNLDEPVRLSPLVIAKTAALASIGLSAGVLFSTFVWPGS